MAKAYRTRSSKGAGGTRRYITQSGNSKPKTTMSYKTGSSTRVAVTRNGNGSVTQRTTQKMADGYTKRTTKTIIPKPKTPKAPKPPKPPKLKTSFVKEQKIQTPKPYKAPSTPKPKPFKWTKSSKKRTSSKSKTINTSPQVNGHNKGEKTSEWIVWAFWGFIILCVLKILELTFS